MWRRITSPIPLWIFRFSFKNKQIMRFRIISLYVYNEIWPYANQIFSYFRNSYLWCKSTLIRPNISVRTHNIYPSFNTEFATSKSHVSPKLLYVYVIDIRQTCYEYFYNVYAWFTLFLEERVEIQNVLCVAKIIDLT